MFPLLRQAAAQHAQEHAEDHEQEAASERRIRDLLGSLPLGPEDDENHVPSDGGAAVKSSVSTALAVDGKPAGRVTTPSTTGHRGSSEGHSSQSNSTVTTPVVDAHTGATTSPLGSAAGKDALPVPTQQPADVGNDDTLVRITKLPQGFSVTQLRILVGRFGALRTCEIHADRATKTCGASISFESPTSAHAVVHANPPLSVDGKPVDVALIKPAPPPAVDTPTAPAGRVVAPLREGWGLKQPLTYAKVAATGLPASKQPADPPPFTASASASTSAPPAAALGTAPLPSPTPPTQLATAPPPAKIATAVEKADHAAEQHAPRPRAKIATPATTTHATSATSGHHAAAPSHDVSHPAAPANIKSTGRFSRDKSPPPPHHQDRASQGQSHAPAAPHHPPPSPPHLQQQVAPGVAGSSTASYPPPGSAAYSPTSAVYPVAGAPVAGYAGAAPGAPVATYVQYGYAPQQYGYAPQQYGYPPLPTDPYAAYAAAAAAAAAAGQHMYDPASAAAAAAAAMPVAYPAAPAYPPGVAMYPPGVAAAMYGAAAYPPAAYAAPPAAYAMSYVAPSPYGYPAPAMYGYPAAAMYGAPAPYPVPGPPAAYYGYPPA
jgi:hypothetical protein